MDGNIVVGERTGAEVDVTYAYEVDSKGKVKPTFKASIKRFLTQEMIEGGISPQKAIIADAEYLVALAQKILDATPKAPPE